MVRHDRGRQSKRKNALDGIKHIFYNYYAALYKGNTVPLDHVASPKIATGFMR